MAMRSQQLVLTCEQARQIVMGAQDVERIGWMLGNFCHGGDRRGVDHAVEELREQRHQEHRDGTGSDHDRRNILRQRARVDGNACHGNDDRQGRGAVQGHGNATIRRHIARRRTNAHRNKNGHGTNNQQRHDKAHEQTRARRHGRQIDLCARYGKEYRNQKAVGQAIELGLERMVALGDDIAQDKAGGKRTQHDVEIKDGRERHECDQDEHRQAHEGLRRGIGAFLDKRKEAAADTLGAAWDHSQQHANHRKQAKDYERLDASAGRQQHRHGEHRAELTPGAIRENRVAHTRASERALTHDGHERAERRRSEGKRHGDTVEMTD